MKKIFIDCGANDGCSIDLFRDQYPNANEYEIHSFEPTPIFRETLEKKNVFYYEKAVSISDDDQIFYFDTRYAKGGIDEYYYFGSTLIKEKMDVTEKAVKKTNTTLKDWKPTQLVVKGIDFSRWIINTFDKDDYIVLKMDIEGAEYDVLEKMIKDRSICYIDIIYLEFHGHKMGEKFIKRGVKILNELRKEKIKIFVGSGKWNTFKNKIELEKDDNKKNLVFWTGLRSKDEFLTKRHSDYSWMDYSKKTWEFWCKENGVDFYAFEEPIEDDLVAHRPNWQRWFEMLEFIDKYAQILSTDASIMVKWDMPDIFNMSEYKFCALKSVENWKWAWESVQGYKPMFNNFDFVVRNHFNSGFVIFNKKHKQMLVDFKKFYYDNYEMVVEYQTKKVKRGTEQPVLNYFIQMNNIDIKFLPLKYGINHLYRWQVLGNNWQLNDDPTPFFIKYFYVWIFSGFPDRGETRNKLMSKTWNIIKHHYGERYDSDLILNEVQHKDNAKYTTSRQFKQDILDMFYNDKFKNKTILELGTSQGQSTRVLSHIFKKVISVEIDDWNIEQAKITCDGRNNIEIIKFDLYENEWNFPKDIDIVFIDANHTYEAVKMDIENSLKHFEKELTLIFDDYGHPISTGVKIAINEFIDNGKLEFVKYIGHSPGTKLNDKLTIIDWEGIICKSKIIKE